MLSTQQESNDPYVHKASIKMILLIQRVALASLALFALHMGASAAVGAVVLSVLSLPTTMITAATYLSGKAILGVISAVATGSFKTLGIATILLASSSCLSAIYEITFLSRGIIDSAFQALAKGYKNQFIHFYR